MSNMETNQALMAMEDEIEHLRAENAELRAETNHMKDLLREILEQILYPLAHEETNLGRTAEGFGQAARAALEIRELLK